jgi:hypothetical protein
MKNLLLIIVLIACVLAIFKYSAEDMVYDCRIAEISPDVPVEVKQECRELTKAGMV